MARALSSSSVDDSDDGATVSLGGAERTTVTQRTAPGPASTEQGLGVGTRVGRYEIREELGRGGMGVVYRAHDPVLDRELALKLLHPRRLSPRATERLVREAQALARLSHPNVVTVFDVSTDPRGVLVAMEYVPGSTLRTWLETRRSWPEVLQVLVEAGQGLWAAHERGLVHRDFKPANVLLGRDGRPRVLDFGLAQLGELRSTFEPDLDSVMHGMPSTLTTTGAVLGTPAYMAPEQHASRRTDARVDQFAFCVTLWEGLHGLRPYVGTFDEMLAAKHRGPPPWPERSPVPRRIALAVCRGLAADPAERWPSMDVLLEALRMPSRRVGWLGLGLGLGGGAFALGMAIAATPSTPTPCEPTDDPLTGVWDQARAEQVARALTTTSQAYAGGAWPGIERALDEHAQAWRDERSAACRATHVDGTQPAEVLDLRMACLERDRGQLRAIVDALIAVRPGGAESVLMAVTELSPPARCADVDALRTALALPDDPALAAEVQSVREQLILARTAIDVRDYPAARARLAPLSAAAEATGHVPLELDTRLTLALLELDDGDPVRAEPILIGVYEQAVAIGDDRAAAEAASRLAVSLATQQLRPGEAKTWAETAVAVAKRVGEGGEPEAMALDALARVERENGDYARAVELQTRALELRERIVGPGHVLTVATRERLGLALDQAGRHDEALEQLSQAYQTLVRTLGPEHPAVAGILTQHAQALSNHGDYAEAEREFTRALEIRERALGPDDPELTDTLLQLGQLHRTRDELEQALPLYERALRIREAAYGSDDPRVAIAMASVAVTLGLQGHHERAERLHRQVLRIRRATLDPLHPAIAESLNNHALVLLDLGRRDEAALTFETALQQYERTLGPEHPALGSPLTNLGNIRLEEGRVAEAEALHRRALAVWRAAYGDTHLRVSEVEYNLARALLEQGHPEEAVDLLGRVIATLEQVLSPEHVYVGEVLRELGLARLAMDAPDEARQTFERARAIAVANAGERSDEVADLEILLARTELASGRAREARARLEGVARWFDGLEDPDDDGTVALELARALVTVGDEARARRVARNARDALPEGAPVRAELTAWLERPAG